MHPNEHRKYRRPAAAAKRIGVATSTLAKLRVSGDGPVYSKVGPKVVIYDDIDLDAYVAGFLSSAVRPNTTGMRS